MLKDRRLGLLKYAFMFAILMYIVVYQLWMNGSYFTRDAPTGTVRFSLWSPAKDAAGNVCRRFKGGTCASTNTAQCPQFSGVTGCKDWDGVDAGLEEQASMLVATRVGVYKNGVSEKFFIKGIEDFTLSIDHSIYVTTKGGNSYHEARNGRRRIPSPLGSQDKPRASSHSQLMTQALPEPQPIPAG